MEIGNDSTTVNNTDTENVTTTTTIPPPIMSKENCYMCTYDSLNKLKPNQINDKNCLKENPKTKVPSPYKICSVWTFSAKWNKINVEITGKGFVTPEMQECYEKVTGFSLEYGKCKSTVQLSKEQLKILTDGDCGYKIKLPKLRSSNQGQAEEEVNEIKERSWFGFDLPKARDIEDILKYKYNYEVCLCKGDLCNNYKKLKGAGGENKKKSASVKLITTFTGITAIFLIFLM